MSGSESRSAWWLLALVASLNPQRAYAQTPQEKVLAESLYLDGRRLLTNGELGEACAKLAESQRLDPASGTALNLADCYERQQRVASAWTAYKATLELSKRAGRLDRIAIASDKLEALAPRLSKLTLKVLGAAPPDLSISVDGIAVGMGGLGTPLAFDAGAHVIGARVPGRDMVEHEVSLAEGESKTFEVPIPALDSPRTPAPPTTLIRKVSSTPVSASHRAWALPVAATLGALGAASWFAGLGTGIRALTLGEEVRRECPNHVCSPEGFAAFEEADTLATAANITLVLGAGLTIAGIAFVIVGATGDPVEATVIAIHADGHVSATVSF